MCHFLNDNHPVSPIRYRSCVTSDPILSRVGKNSQCFFAIIPSEPLCVVNPINRDYLQLNIYMLFADKAHAFSETSENQQERYFMNWSTPSYQDLRFGFEINLYINNR
ncbi:MAG: pyrroloquinoline quinone precursor peptide PqqA [Candidatus Thiodiazotropha endolucinida]